MPKIVGCPKCGKRYKLPDTFTAKRVRCKACSVEFATDYDQRQLRETSDNLASPTPQKKKPAPQRKPAPQQRKPSPAQQKPNPPQRPVNDALAKAGLSQIQKQPDLFSDEQIDGPDPLRNHVVQDPGFGGSGGAGAAQNRRPAAAGDGHLDDIVSNPYLDGAGAAGSIDARRKEALKRKKEDEILAAYKTNDTPLNHGGGSSDMMDNGLTRAGYFWIHFAASTVVKIIDRSAGFLSQLQPPGGANAKPPAEMAAATGYLILFGVLAALAVAGGFYTFTINLRFQNMKLKNGIWKKLATYLTAAPFALWCVALLLGIIFLLALVPAIGYAALFIALIGVLFTLPMIPFSWAAMVIPPDFGIHQKLDTWSYVWLVVLAIPFVIIFGGIIVGVFMGLSNAF